jgi:Tol biopolymer transport system component
MKASLFLLLCTITIALTGCPAFFAQAPVAIISCAPTSGEAPLHVNCNGSGSFDPNTNGTITQYQWNFGDGTPLVTGVTQSHSYSVNGTFIVNLKVTNGFAKVGVDLLPITVGKSSIFFSSNRSGNYNIFRMDTSGGSQAQVTNYASGDALWPALLPNTRNQLAYSFNPGGGSKRFQIFTSNVDGTLPIQLTTQTSSNSIQPSWSPDGSKIAFASDQSKATCGCWGIYLMNSDGTGVTPLRVQSGSNNFAPTISPDGTKIAFVSNNSGNYDIWGMNINGTGAVNLTNNPNNDGGPQGTDSNLLPGAHSAVSFSRPSWSPTGTQIAFTSNRTGGTLNIFIMNADGTNAIQLTTSSANYDPHWLPTSTEVAFVSTLSGSPQVWKINTSTHAQVQLTSTGTNLNPAGLK